MSEGPGAVDGQAACELIAGWIKKPDKGILPQAVTKADAAALADSRLQPLSMDVRAVFTHQAAGDEAGSNTYNMFDSAGTPQTPEQAQAEATARTEWDAARSAVTLLTGDCAAVGHPFKTADQEAASAQARSGCSKWSSAINELRAGSITSDQFGSRVPDAYSATEAAAAGDAALYGALGTLSRNFLNGVGGDAAVLSNADALVAECLRLGL